VVKPPDAADNGRVKRMVPAGLLAMTVLAACSTGTSTPTQRYYDPGGLFSAQLPEPNDILVMPPQAVQGSPPLLSGVLSLPPQPSPSSSGTAFGSGNNLVEASANEDNAIYAVFVVKAKKYKTVAELAQALLSATQSPNLVSQEAVRAGGLDGLITVVDHPDDSGGGGEYSDASGFFLDGEVGYWIRELFGFGEWGSRRDAFLSIVRSFKPGVPPGLPAIPITRAGLEVRSGIGWPLG
jgi:hypothetical protein